MYRFADSAGEADTVPFGSFRKTLIDKIGPYNEALLTNEDYEFNTRIRKTGGRVWLDPTIRSIYFARATFLELLRQYWRYGFWKWRMLRRFPDTVRWRQALPPLFVLSLIGLVTLSVFIPAFWWVLAAEAFIYISILFLAGARAALRHRKPFLLSGLALAISIMHIAWGSGFLWSMLTSRQN
jgi:hypothetical protein